MSSSVSNSPKNTSQPLSDQPVRHAFQEGMITFQPSARWEQKTRYTPHPHPHIERIVQNLARDVVEDGQGNYLLSLQKVQKEVSGLREDLFDYDVEVLSHWAFEKRLLDWTAVPVKSPGQVVEQYVKFVKQGLSIRSACALAQLDALKSGTSVHYRTDLLENALKDLIDGEHQNTASTSESSSATPISQVSQVSQAPQEEPSLSNRSKRKRKREIPSNSSTHSVPQESPSSSSSASLAPIHFEILPGYVPLRSPYEVQWQFSSPLRAGVILEPTLAAADPQTQMLPATNSSSAESSLSPGQIFRETIQNSLKTFVDGSQSLEEAARGACEEIRRRTRFAHGVPEIVKAIEEANQKAQETAAKILLMISQRIFNKDN